MPPVARAFDLMRKDKLGTTSSCSVACKPTSSISFFSITSRMCRPKCLRARDQPSRRLFDAIETASIPGVNVQVPRELQEVEHISPALIKKTKEPPLGFVIYRAEISRDRSMRGVQ